MATNSISTYNRSNLSEFAVSDYTKTTKFGKVTLNSEDRKFATYGFLLAQPDWLPEGYNGISGGYSDGRVGLLGNQYVQGEDNVLEPVTSSWQCTA